jgi:hypothetical protein
MTYKGLQSTQIVSDDADRHILSLSNRMKELSFSDQHFSRIHKNRFHQVSTHFTYVTILFSWICGPEVAKL